MIQDFQPVTLGSASGAFQVKNSCPGGSKCLVSENEKYPTRESGLSPRLLDKACLARSSTQDIVCSKDVVGDAMDVLQRCQTAKKSLWPEICQIDQDIDSAVNNKAEIKQCQFTRIFRPIHQGSLEESTVMHFSAEDQRDYHIHNMESQSIPQQHKSRLRQNGKYMYVTNIPKAKFQSNTMPENTPNDMLDSLSSELATQLSKSDNISNIQSFSEIPKSPSTYIGNPAADSQESATNTPELPSHLASSPTNIPKSPGSPSSEPLEECPQSPSPESLEVSSILHKHAVLRGSNVRCNSSKHHSQSDYNQPYSSMPQSDSAVPEWIGSNPSMLGSKPVEQVLQPEIPKTKSGLPASQPNMPGSKARVQVPQPVLPGPRSAMQELESGLPDLKSVAVGSSYTDMTETNVSVSPLRLSANLSEDVDRWMVPHTNVIYGHSRRFQATDERRKEEVGKVKYDNGVDGTGVRDKLHGLLVEACDNNKESTCDTKHIILNGGADVKQVYLSDKSFMSLELTQENASQKVVGIPKEKVLEEIIRDQRMQMSRNVREFKRRQLKRHSLVSETKTSGYYQGFY